MSEHPVDRVARTAADSGALRYRLALAAGAVAAMAAALAVPAAHGGSPEGRLKDVSIDELKSVYLTCSRAAIDRHLGSPAIMQCSVVYEELKRRAFDGDFHKLLAWSQAQPQVEVSRR